MLLKVDKEAGSWVSDIGSRQVGRVVSDKTDRPAGVSLGVETAELI